MSLPTDVVVAGSKAFALALFAPITERAGTRPRIAVDPGQALSLCGDASGLLVVEYDPRWLPALQQLRQQAPGRKVVAALPRGQEAAALALAPLAVDAVPWDGHAAAVLVGVERALGAAPAARPAAPRATTAPSVPVAPRAAVTVRPPPAPPPPAIAPPPAPAAHAASPEGVAGLFDDLEEAPVPVAPPPGAAPPPPPRPATASPPLPAAATAVAPPRYTGPSASVDAPAPPAWPTGIPGVDEAEAALVMKHRGRLPADAPLAAVAEQALVGMNELERAAVEGAALPFDAGPVLRAAVMRFRVAVAIATAPPPPAAVDAAAVAALVAELDTVLAEVNGLTAAAPPDLQPALGFIRNALVKEAVDFSEVAHQVASAPARQPEAAPPRPSARAATTRVLSVQASSESELPEERRRRTGPLATLILVVLAAVAYHGYRYVTAPRPSPPPTLQGAPAGTHSVLSPAGKMLVRNAGATVDRAELERFIEQERRAGRVVRETAPGRWVIEPATPGSTGAKP